MTLLLKCDVPLQIFDAAKSPSMAHCQWLYKTIFRTCRLVFMVIIKIMFVQWRVVVEQDQIPSLVVAR